MTQPKSNYKRKTFILFHQIKLYGKGHNFPKNPKSIIVNHSYFRKKKVQLSFEDEDLLEPQSYKVTKNPNINKETTLNKMDQIRKPSNT